MIDIELKPYPGENENAFTKRKAYFIRIVKPRMDYGNMAIEKKLVSAVPLTSAEREEIDTFWSQYMSPSVRERLIDYRYYEVFKSTKSDSDKLCYYIPDSFYYAFIDEFFTNPQHSHPCDDKNLYDLYFHDINRPKTVFRLIHGMLLDEDYTEITLNEAINKARDKGEVILKIASFSEGGRGIMFWNSANNSVNELKDFLSVSDNIICQEIINQHPVLNELNQSSINTIRIMTLVYRNKVHIMSSAIRFGAKGNRTDNISSGGLACGLFSDGRLKPVAYDYEARKHICDSNAKPFEEIIIPSYGRCVEIVNALARRFVSLSRLISWDLAIDEKGNPLLIEFNLTYGGISFHQFCNGPILGSLSDDILSDVFSNSYTLNSIIKS